MKPQFAAQAAVSSASRSWQCKPQFIARSDAQLKTARKNRLAAKVSA